MGTIEQENNKKTESRKGGTKTATPAISANEMEAIEPILTNEQIDANRLGYKEYTMTPFDAEKAREEAKKSSVLLQMTTDARNQELEFKKKSESASKYAKAVAWGNMFRALGQLAGLGKNTYVKPDDSPLARSLAKADEARDIYDKIRLANQEKIRQAEDDYVSRLEKRHWENEQLKERSVYNYNRIMQAQNEAELNDALTRYKLNLEDQYKKGMLKYQQYKAETERLENQANERIKELEIESKNITQRYKSEADAKKNAYITHTDDESTTDYYLSESDALDIANIMLKNKEYSEDKLGLVGSYINGTLQVKDAKAFKAVVKDFIDKNIGNPEIKTILNRGSWRNQTSSEDEKFVDFEYK